MSEEQIPANLTPDEAEDMWMSYGQPSPLEYTMRVYALPGRKLTRITPERFRQLINGIADAFKEVGVDFQIEGYAPESVFSAYWQKGGE